MKRPRLFDKRITSLITSLNPVEYCHMPWLFPLPLQMIPSETGVYPANQRTWLPIKNHPGAFGAPRKHHRHEGVDLYAPEGTPVYAVEEGTVVYIEWFTGEKATPPSPWWHNTQAVFVEGPTGVVVYGEIRPSPQLELNQPITQGTLIGWVTEVLKIDKQRPTCMLHLELYQHGQRESLIWEVHAPQPTPLLDPTPHLFSSSSHPPWKASFYTKSLQLYQNLLPTNTHIPTVCEWIKKHPFERLFLDLDGRRFFDLMLQHEEEHWEYFWQAVAQCPGGVPWINQLLKPPKFYHLLQHPPALLGLIKNNPHPILSESLEHFKLSEISFLNHVLQHYRHLSLEVWKEYWRLLFKWQVPLLEPYPNGHHSAVRCPYIYQYFLMPHHWLQDLSEDHLLFLQDLSREYGQPWSTELLCDSDFFTAQQEQWLPHLPWNYLRIETFKTLETEHHLNKYLLSSPSPTEPEKDKKRL